MSAPLLLFDGDCALCAWGVSLVLRRERPGGRPVRFVALRSAEGRRLAAIHGIDALDPDTLLLVQDGRALRRSDAVLALAGRLRGPWGAVRLMRWVPRPLRDRAYDLVARRRRRLFGTACILPAPEHRGRFVLPEPEP